MPRWADTWPASVAVLLILWAGAVRGEETGQGGEPPVRFGGYLKTMYEKSRTADPEDQEYNLSLTRLRLKLDAGAETALSAHVELDTELRVGNYLDTQEFQTLLELPSWQYAWGGDYELATGANSYLSQRFHRAYVRDVWNNVELMLGRQRIALGTGRFWSGLDLLNPNNPLRIEQDERIGVDALRVEYKAGNITRWVYIAAPDPLEVGTRQLAQFSTNLAGVDVTLTGGMVRNDGLYGVDFATQLAGAGLHGEWVYTRADIGDDYQKFLFGADYGFVNGLTLSAEAFRSTQSSADLAATIAAIPQLPYLQPVGLYYIGASATYEPGPIYKINLMWLRNLDDHSAFATATATYSFTDNMLVAAGVQAFSGEPTTDFGRAKPLFYTYYQWYF